MEEKNKKIIKKIDKYLDKRGHRKYLSIFLENYNNYDLYIRFDYVNKIRAYKVVWFDLKYLNLNKIGDYLNCQLVNSFLVNNLVTIMINNSCPSVCLDDKDVYGDRVYINNCFFKKEEEYNFVRFLPDSLKFLIDPIVIIFSFLPRSFESLLNEIFARLDGLDAIYNAKRPIKFNIFKDDLAKIFSKKDIEKAEKMNKSNKVTFLEKINDKYLAIIEEKDNKLVILHQIDDEFVVLWCSCEKETYCDHLCAVLLALREKKFNKFYKVKYKQEQVSLLDEISNGMFYCCFGVSDDNLMIISEQGGISVVPIMENGKCMFEVIEDDDECSLSKIIDSYKDK